MKALAAFVNLVEALALSAIAICLMSMFYALPVMLGIWLWSFIF